MLQIYINKADKHIFLKKNIGARIKIKTLLYGSYT